MPVRYRILIVDDDRLTRWSTRERLRERSTLQIDEAADADEALAKLAAKRYDLVLLDIGLPGMTGDMMLPFIVSSYPGIRVIMVTAASTEGIALRCLDQGAFDFIGKPVDLDVIDAVVVRALELDMTKSGTETASDLRNAHAFIGESDASRQIRRDARKIVTSRASTVLIQGESGTGKEVLSRFIHSRSSPDRPFMAINCSALPSRLLESELFGFEKGAFTDAKEQKKGLFELAEEGTLLLDEIGDLEIFLQAKLLRVIEERSFKRVGGVEDIEMDLRIIATTNVDLEQAVDEGKFRKDLFYRLNVIPMQIPPLRERREDIPPLIDHFIGIFNQDLNTSLRGVSQGAMSLLTQHAWPGNARELRNVLERIAVVEAVETILVDHLPPEVRNPDTAANATPASAEHTDLIRLPEKGVDLEAVERLMIRQALERAGGNITRAGALIGLHRDTLRYRARKYGILTTATP